MVIEEGNFAGTNYLTRLDATGNPSPVFPANPTLYSASYWQSGVWVAEASGDFVPLPSTTDVPPAEEYAMSDGTEHRGNDEPSGVAFEPDPAAQNAVSSVNGNNVNCTGLDDTPKMDPRWLMVPINDNPNFPGQNTVQLHIRHNWENVALQVCLPAEVGKPCEQDPNNTVTVTPQAPTGERTTLAVTGNLVGIVQIRAVDKNNPETVLGRLNATVKPRLTKTLDLFKVIDPVNNLVPNRVPDAGLQIYLNQVWGKQANVFFTVNPTQDLSVHWDLLPAPNGNGVMDDFSNGQDGPGDLTELFAVMNAISQANPASATHLAAAYINKFGPRKGVVCAEGHTCELDGLTFTNTSPAMISGSSTVARTLPNLTAHEVGHSIGARDVTTGTGSQDLMWTPTTQTGAAPCQVRRRDWKLVNPTPNDDRSSK